MDVVERLVAERPSFHLGGACRWNALPETLALISRTVSPGARTVETGTGASTVVFAACGARHTAISPAPDEHERIRAWCAGAGVDASAVDFVAAPSDRALPGLAGERFDAAFVDGKHSFPHPVIDWHYVAAGLRVGGALVVDDLAIPAVAVVARHMLLDPAWELVEVVDDRAGLFVKRAEPEAHDDWEAQPFNRDYPDFGFLRPGRRLAAVASHRVQRARRRLGDNSPFLRAAWRRLGG